MVSKQPDRVISAAVRGRTDCLWRLPNIFGIRQMNLIKMQGSCHRFKAAVQHPRRNSTSILTGSISSMSKLILLPFITCHQAAESLFLLLVNPLIFPSQQTLSQAFRDVRSQIRQQRGGPHLLPRVRVRKHRFAPGFDQFPYLLVFGFVCTLRDHKKDMKKRGEHSGCQRGHQSRAAG